MQLLDPVDTRKVISMGIEAANHAPITKQYNIEFYKPSL